MSFKRTLGAALIGALVAIPLATVSSDAQAQETVRQESLETLVGPLAKTVPQLKLETIQTACQITNERRTNTELRSKWFYTADTSLYRMEDGGVFLYFGNDIVNPVLKNVGVASKELINNINYFPKKEDVEAVVNAEDTLKVNLADLRLKGTGNEWLYLEIETDNYDKLNETERAFAERVYCQGGDFVKNMAMLNNTSITTTRIYVLNPEYVKEKAKGQAVARASWLSYFGYDSSFGAIDSLVDLHSGLRGVPKNIADK